MASTWRVLLLLGLATAVIALPRRKLTFRDASVLAARRFNGNLNEGAKYRVLVSSLQTPDSPLVLPLTFRIKETECPSSGLQNPETCAFKENGLEKNCTAKFTRLTRFGLGSVECQDVGNNNLVRFKRSASSGIIDTSSLPPKIRQIYNQAVYDTLVGILRNF
ncbi:neutrophilic granule protein-like [Phascolarctos cinereus]|uniref:Neutrophilic granule protein-like n=1 Tax=Phascolarctos cinereus TaxID=38626 RepID=A0A6P5LAL0_PHACI|nr:neutrophilic granule protein-like [Phascolarctos cinereus]